MKVSSLFNLIADASDLLDYFEGVNTQEQLVSRLERLKRQGTEELFACVEGLRASVVQILGDTLEMSAAIDEGETPDDSDLDAELAALEGGEDEKQNQETSAPSEDAKNDGLPDT